MLDKMLDTYSKAVESTLKLQQEMLGKLDGSNGSIPIPGPGTQAGARSEFEKRGWGKRPGWTIPSCSEKMGGDGRRVLNRHRETLDEQYRAGIRALDEVFKAGEVKDPEQLRRFSEHLWKHSLKTLETAVTSQLHDVQTVLQKWFEATSAGVKDRSNRFAAIVNSPPDR